MIGLIKRPQMFKTGEILFTKMINPMGNQAFVPRKPNNLKVPLTPTNFSVRIKKFRYCPVYYGEKGFGL